MNPTEQKILEALKQLDRAAAEAPSASPKPSIRELLAEIDSLTAQLPPETPPNLRHFLERKSYQKARMVLEGRQDQVSRGTCGR